MTNPAPAPVAVAYDVRKDPSRVRGMFVAKNWIRGATYVAEIRQTAMGGWSVEFSGRTHAIPRGDHYAVLATAQEAGDYARNVLRNAFGTGKPERVFLGR